MDSINRVENDAWFTGWSPDAEELDDEGMQALHYDPAHYLNIYSVQLWEPVLEVLLLTDIQLLILIIYPESLYIDRVYY